VHAMRARHDAVIVGAGTVRADNPQLTVRGMGNLPQPVRIVFSSDLNMPLEATLFQTTDVAPVWVYHGDQADSAPFAALGVKTMGFPMQNRMIDPVAALQALAVDGLTRLFCEGGGTFAAILLKAGLVDRLEVFQAGKVIGAEGLAGIGPLFQDVLRDVPQFTCVGTRQVGPDTLTSWEALAP